MLNYRKGWWAIAWQTSKNYFEHEVLKWIQLTHKLDNRTEKIHILITFLVIGDYRDIGLWTEHRGTINRRRKVKAAFSQRAATRAPRRGESPLAPNRGSARGQSRFNARLATTYEICNFPLSTAVDRAASRSVWTLNAKCIWCRLLARLYQRSLTACIRTNELRPDICLIDFYYKLLIEVDDRHIAIVISSWFVISSP